MMYKIFIVVITILCLGCASSKKVEEPKAINVLKETVSDYIYVTYIGHVGINVFVDPETNVEYLIIGNEKGVAITPRLKQEVKN